MADDAAIRRANLVRLLKTPKEAHARLGGDGGLGGYSYWASLMNDPKKPFGEKMARKIEERMNWPRGLLDALDELEPTHDAADGEEVDNGYGARLAAAMGTTSTQALADHLGVSYTAVQKVLKGTSKFFKVPHHYKVADFLGVNPRWLATGEGERSAAQRPALLPDWRTIALQTAKGHPWEEGRVLLGDFIADVDANFAKLTNPTTFA